MKWIVGWKVSVGFLWLVIVLTFLTSCSMGFWGTGRGKSDETKLVIPDFDNAKDQYTFATAYQQALVLSTEPRKRNIQLDKIIQCHSKVVQNFPNDGTYTPLSFLVIAGAKAAQSRYSEAREMYEQALKRWPDNDYVQAQALFSIAQTYDRERKHSKAQELYRQVIERFKDNPSTGIQRIVAQARTLYLTVKEEPKEQARPRSGGLRGIFKRFSSLGKHP